MQKKNKHKYIHSLKIRSSVSHRSVRLAPKRHRQIKNKLKTKRHRQPHFTYRNNQKGGALANRSFCKNGTETYPEPALNPREYNKQARIMSPGFELLTSTDTPFELNAGTIGLFNKFTRANNKWFKFVIFKFREVDHLYVMYGNPENNKHPLCMIYGYLEHSGVGDLSLFRKAIKDVIDLKKNINNGIINMDTIDEDNAIITKFNAELFNNFGCMVVLSAGSGTILENGSICLNNKSGHFKPALSDLLIAQTMFRNITGRDVRLRLAADKGSVESELSTTIPQFNYNNYSGTCLPSQDIYN